MADYMAAIGMRAVRPGLPTLCKGLAQTMSHSWRSPGAAAELCWCAASLRRASLQATGPSGVASARGRAASRKQTGQLAGRGFSVPRREGRANTRDLPPLPRRFLYTPPPNGVIRKSLRKVRICPRPHSLTGLHWKRWWKVGPSGANSIPSLG